jgi:UDP:flavonoid glycosyltransferase YjiC (YdhE family)
MATPPAPIRPSRIVLTAIGSLGDIHPSIAIGLGLRARGHDVIVATSACYQRKIESLGLAFRAIRPDSDFVTDPLRMRRIMHPRWGTVRVGREILAPTMRQTYEDLAAASVGANLLVSHPLVNFEARLVSEKTGIPWASTMITPLGFLSAYDFPIIPVAPLASQAMRLLSPDIAAPLIGLAKRATRFLARPWYELRADIGLPSTREANPLIDSHSPRLVLATFSRLFAAFAPDWPPNTINSGFPLFDRDGGDGLPPALAQFLDAGSPPIVFTLGCSAAMVADDFFQTSIAAVQRLGRRAVLIVGRGGQLPTSLPPGVTAHEYAPFSELFPRAAVIVHAGGIGTTGLAMRAGKPSLVVPFAHDQFDNAARAARIGLARVLHRSRYTPAPVAAELRRLLKDRRYGQRAAHVGTQIRQEDGVRTACDALERLISSPSHG